MPSIPWLDERSLQFPDIDRALDDPNGLLAVGGDLSPERLLTAYQHGIFPWYEDPQPVLWWSPQPRAVLFPENLHCSRSLRKQLRRESYRVSADCHFSRVLDKCAALSPKRPGTWITNDMRLAYNRMHELGWAHSIEVHLGDELIGGLYGLALGQVFFGESMFSLGPSGSKIALVALCAELLARHFKVIDCQVGNDYLYSMGAELIPREQLKALLAQYAQPHDDQRGHWTLGDASKRRVSGDDR